MPNNVIRHTEYGPLDLRLPDLGRPDIPFLWEILLGDKRLVEQRQLMCGEICFDMGRTEWMHVYERQGRRIAAHQSHDAERRHVSGDNESPEHKAYKERTIRVAEAAGHQAEAEVRASDGKVITDVLVIGADGDRFGFEIQHTYAPEGKIVNRDKLALERGINAAWHTDQRDIFSRNEVPWTRTDNLSAAAIIDGRDLLIRGGIRNLTPWLCNYSIPTACPTKKRGRCGGYHFTPEPLPMHYDDYVRSVAAGELVKVEFHISRGTNLFWTPLADRDRYENEREASATVRAVPRPRPPTSPALGGATCRDRIVLAGAAGLGARLAEVDDFRDVIPIAEAFRRSAVAVIPPPRSKPIPRVCGDGATPCGAPARLYPGGWRCDDHSPGAYRRRGAT